MDVAKKMVKFTTQHNDTGLDLKNKTVKTIAQMQ